MSYSLTYATFLAVLAVVATIGVLWWEKRQTNRNARKGGTP